MGGTMEASYHTRICDWPEHERPRERLLHAGAGSLSDAELLAILLRSGSGGATAVDLAKAMLSRYGSLGNIAGRSVSDMMQFRGLGSVKAVTLASAFELGRRAAVFGGRERFQIRTPEDVVRHVQPMIRDLHQEVFVVLLLD